MTPTARDYVLGALHLQGWHCDEMPEETRLFALEGFDSLDEVELVMEIETRAGIEITDAQMDDVQTIGDLIKLVEQACG